MTTESFIYWVTVTIFLRKHFPCRFAYPIDIRIGHRREKRQGGDAAADALGVRKLAGAPAEIAVELEEMHRRIVHADADALFAHRGDEFCPGRAIGQDHLEHVPIRLFEILQRQLAAEAAVPLLEVAPGELAAPLRKAL